MEHQNRPFHRQNGMVFPFRAADRTKNRKNARNVRRSLPFESSIVQKSIKNAKAYLWDSRWRFLDQINV